MQGFTYLDRPLAREELAERLFGGELIVYCGLAPMARLVEMLRVRSELAFGRSPETAHLDLGFEALLARAGQLRRDVADDLDIRQAFAALFAALGFAQAETFWDRRVLRLVPPGPRREEPALRSVPPHRDSWGANIPAQINWWAPVYPVTAARTLLFYPRHWRQPIANTTPHWNLEGLYAARAQGTAYPGLPVAAAEPAQASALPCLIEPGELLCFSAAQLHASAPNSSDRTRFSLETRTVSLLDFAAGRGAPNVDGHPGIVASHWFTRIADDVSLRSVIGEGETALPEGGST